MYNPSFNPSFLLGLMKTGFGLFEKSFKISFYILICQYRIASNPYGPGRYRTTTWKGYAILELGLADVSSQH